jgi:hypothetical protein
METKKLPVGIQSFEKLRDADYLYVDKTEYIWNLVQNGSVYFLSRPRRFGKSLLVSTLEAYFLGKKDLFHGLTIEKYENQKGSMAWQVHPVIHFSLSGGNYLEKDGLQQRLSNTLDHIEKVYGVEGGNYDLPNRFINIIRNLHAKTNQQVVVLVDEYDKPLLETMGIDALQEEKNRQLYKSFFSVLKDEDAHLRFVFFTGVTKFSKVSVFSDLNQLNDISMDPQYAGICGISDEEMQENFSLEIDALAKAQGISRKECIDTLAKMYDGYHFSRNSIGVYNPFSLLNAFFQKDFGNYWFETGRPSFLIHALKESVYVPEDFEAGIRASEDEMKNFGAQSNQLIPLYYQSGYLTISGYDPQFRKYILTFPNQEVKYGFVNSFIPYVFGSKKSESSLSVDQMVMDLNAGDINAFLNRIKALFAGIPYLEMDQAPYEQMWRNQFWTIFTLMGQYTACEVHTAKGRIDCIVNNKKYIYLFEFKVDQSAEEALKQIERQRYASVFSADGRTVMKIGISFSSKERNIVNWTVI